MGANLKSNNMSEKLIHNSYLHSYLNNRQRELISSKRINYEEILNELSFTISKKYMDELPYHNYYKIQLPQFSDEWYYSTIGTSHLMMFMEENPNPEIIYLYNYWILEKELFSIVYYWMLSYIDEEASLMRSSYLDHIKSHLEFISQNVKNRMVFNQYLDLWIDTLSRVMEGDELYLINLQPVSHFIDELEFNQLIEIFKEKKK